MRKAQVMDGIVVDIFDLPDLAAIEAANPSSTFVPCGHAVERGWLCRADGVFSEPPLSPPPSEEPLTPTAVVDWAERKLRAAIADIPEVERQTWGNQVIEARSVLESEGLATPLLSAQAAVTGESLVVLSNKVLGKSRALLAYSGAVIGVRRKYLDLLQGSIPGSRPLFTGVLDFELAIATKDLGD